jgi:hypothetical protein
MLFFPHNLVPASEFHMMRAKICNNRSVTFCVISLLCDETLSLNEPGLMGELYVVGTDKQVERQRKPRARWL